MRLRGFWARLMAPWRRGRLEGELEEEIAAHLEMAEREGIARGLSAAEARRVARVRFGGIEAMKEVHRERRTFPVLESFRRDFGYGARALGRSPGFSAIVVCVLALGIGANVGMFSILDAVLLRPLPFAAPERMVGVWEAPRPGVTNAATAGQFLEWKRLGSGFEGLSAEQDTTAALSGTGEPARLTGKAVTADYFTVFPVDVRMGRTFAAQDTNVVVLSYAAWQTYFGADPQVLGRRPLLDGEPYQVIGVLAPSAFDRSETKFWRPLVFTPEQQAAQVHWLTVFGRLRAGVGIEQAREKMAAIHAAMTEGGSREERESAIAVEPFGGMLFGPGLARAITVAFGAVGVVLLVACANVANLLLARGATRRRELAVRSALGASRGRLVLQLFTESLVLCFAGGAAGVGVAALFLRAVKPLLADSLPFTAAVSLDPRAMGFAGMAACGAALLTGVLPAFQTTFGNLAEAMKESARGSSGLGHARIRRAIVVVEVALSVVLVSGAMLLVRSLSKLQALETGIRTDHVVTMSLDLPVGSYRTPEKAAVFYRAVRERLASTPGVVSAGLSTVLPLEWIGNGEVLFVPGGDRRVRVRFKRVDPGYFATLGIAVMAGRGIEAQDDGRRRVMVINEAAVARLAEAGLTDPVGKLARVSTPGYTEPQEFFPETEIVGVIRNEKVSSPGTADPAVVYVPLAQSPAPGVKLLVRSRGEAAAVMPSVRAAIRDVDPGLPIGDVATMESVQTRTLAGVRQPAWLMGLFGAAALVLTAVGLYGVISHAVTQQTREIGIRMALGARAGDVVRGVLTGAMGMVGLGLAVGMLGTWGATRVLRSLLYEVSPLDPLALSAGCVVMVAVGVVAGAVPAVRAARVDPLGCLRGE